MAKVYLGLVHYPIYNRNMQVVTGSVTNFDIHDISRTCTTYSIEKYFVIHPAPKQQDIINEILTYWREGYGSIYNPDRNQAVSSIQLVSDIAESIRAIEEQTGQKPVIMTTDARTYPNTVSYSYARDQIIAAERPVLLLFGTGWGMTDDTMAAFDYILEPIYGVGEYNHLCVRSAVAIILDRLLGTAWWTTES